MRIIRYGFPIFAAMVMAMLFVIPNDIVKSIIVGFILWGLMEVAGRVTDLEDNPH